MVSTPGNALNITSAGIVKFDGTATFGADTVTQHDVLVGGSSNSITSVAPSATSGVALISQGAAADPAFGTVVVAGGGTGAVTLTGVLTGNGTSAVTASTVTQHGVLLGGASNAVGSTSVGTTGQILQANTTADPTYSTATYPSTATGTGTILRADGTNWVATTSTYPNTNAVSTLLYASASNVMSALTTANDGLLVTSNTGVPSILAGPGTTGNILQSNAAAAPSFSTATYPSTTTVNQLLYSSSTNVVGGVTAVIDGVLISNHAAGVPSWLANSGTPGWVLTAQSGAPPAWAAAGSSSITITGDSGGGLTGTSFTFTGGTTGLTFAGSSHTETLSGVLVVANGGTGNSSFSQVGGIITYDGSGLVSHTSPKVTAVGQFNTQTQPAAIAYLSGNVTNVTGDGTTYQIAFDSTLLNVNSSFNTGTNTFTSTANVTGQFLFTGVLYSTGYLSTHTNARLELIDGDVGTRPLMVINPFAMSVAGTLCFSFSILVRSTSTNPFNLNYTVTGGTKVIGITGTSAFTSWEGYFLG